MNGVNWVENSPNETNALVNNSENSNFLNEDFIKNNVGSTVENAGNSNNMEGFKGRSGRSMLSNSGFVFGAGSINTCPPTDTSFYCKFSRVFSLIMMVLTLSFIAYFLYSLVGLKFGKKSPLRLFGGLRLFKA